MRYEDSFLRVNTVPYNKNFIPFVGKLVTQQPLGFCKENFGTNEYWTLQLIKSSRKHKLELRNDSGEVRLFESYTSGVFFSSSMVVDLELEANQETTVLSVNLHRDWLCEQLGINESVEPDEVKLRELLMSKSASFLCISTYPDWIDDLVEHVEARMREQGRDDRTAGKGRRGELLYHAGQVRCRGHHLPSTIVRVVGNGKDKKVIGRVGQPGNFKSFVAFAEEHLLPLPWKPVVIEP